MGNVDASIGLVGRWLEAIAEKTQGERPRSFSLKVHKMGVILLFPWTGLYWL